MEEKFVVLMKELDELLILLKSVLLARNY